MDKDTISEPKPQRKLITKREFLKLSAVAVGGSAFTFLGIDSLLAHFNLPVGATLTEGFWNQLETSTLGMSETDVKSMRDGVEKKFCVDVVSPTDQSTVTLSGYGEGAKVPLVEWKAPELVVLTESLMNLPSKMYGPNKNGGRVRFIMLEKAPDLTPGSAGTAAFCMCNGNGDLDSVVIGRSDYPQLGIGRVWTRSAHCHELTHRVIADDRTDLPGLGQLLGIVDEKQLGEIFSTYDGLSTWPANLNYGGTNYQEFAAVGAEVYLFGKEKMCNIYLPYLGQEGALRFYVWLKLNVFDGAEYQQGKMVK